MRNEKSTNSCLFGEELVAYIYDELSSTRRSVFEDHLLNCSGCTAEFADISMSRLDVFEWHRDEFLPLATPHFVIPIGRKPAVPQYSWFEALRTLVWTPTRMAFAGASLAITAAAFGLLFIANSDPNVDVVTGGAQVVSPVDISIRQVPLTSETVAFDSPSVENKAPTKREFRGLDSVRRTKAIQVTAAAPKKRTKTVTTSAQNVPRLGNFVEPEDTSLRLADLMADIDTKDF
jgi:hypothetical protein